MPRITKVIFYLDDDNDFNVLIRGGENPDRPYLICVILKDHMDINYKESRAIRLALKLAERGTRLTEGDFKEWAKKLQAIGKVRLAENPKHNALIINVRPTPPSGTLSAKELPAVIHRLGIMMDDSSGNIFAIFTTDVDTYVMMVHLEARNKSFGDLQTQATHDVFLVGEQGDKMDNKIFLQYCARLQKKYNLVSVSSIGIEEGHRQKQVLLATIVPTKIDPEEANVSWSSEIALPDVTEDNDWAESTTNRVFAELAAKPHLLARVIGDGDDGRHHEGGTRASTPPTENSFSSSSTHTSNESLPVFGRGRVTAKSLLKRSGQATVFRGTLNDRASTKEVAIKVFHNEDDWQDCQQELIGLLRISGHPNVMEVLEFYEVPKPCFVMDLVSGGDLLDYIETKGHALSQDEAFVILKGIGEGLKHLHDNSIVHRDLKSPNVLIETKGSTLRPVLIDLGLGKRLSDSASSIVQSTGMKGTCLWMSPEMMQENSWSKPTDLYAVGVMMWEILTGRVPYENMNVIQIIAFVVTQGGRPDRDRLTSAGVCTAQRQLIEDLWATNPKSRPTADQFLERLEAAFPSSSARPGVHPIGTNVGANTGANPVQRDMVDQLMRDFPSLFNMNADQGHGGSAGKETGVLFIQKPCTDPFTGRSARLTGDGDENMVPNGFGLLRYPGVSKSVCLTDWKGGRIHGLGIYMRTPNERYFGEWNGEGEPDGVGVKLFPNGNVYFGAFSHGILQGFGRMVYPDGSIYEGFFHSNMKAGRGVLYDSRGNIAYKGSWSRDEPDNGSQVPASQSYTPAGFVTKKVAKDPWGVPGLFTGYVNSSGKPHGWGVLLQSNSVREAYYAKWSNGNVLFYGLYVWRDSRWYLGDWKANKSHNRGIEITGAGSFYMGEFEAGKKEGRGMTAPPPHWDSLYCGDVRNNRMHGEGSLLGANGDLICKGSWVDGLYRED